MLVNTKTGREVKPEKLPKNRRAREAALAAAHEVHVLPKKHGAMFTLESRAKLVQK